MEYKIELTGSPIEIMAKKAAIDALVKMNKQDRDTVSQLVQLPQDDKDRMGELIKNRKALDMLRDNWTALKVKIMIS